VLTSHQWYRDNGIEVVSQAPEGGVQLLLHDEGQVVLLAGRVQVAQPETAHTYNVVSCSVLRSPYSMQLSSS
jgi:hypothetical protein